jgi:hypothetical protein
MTKVLQLNPKTITKVLLCIISLLLAANLAYIISLFVFKIPRALKLGPFFYFNGEGNFPALYSSLAILLSAVLLWKIGSLRTEKANKQSFSWKLLSGVFVFLALDEFLAIHELLIEPTRNLLANADLQGSVLYFAWFIPYCLIFGFIGLCLLRFFFRLPFQTRILFAIAGFIFIAGAVGMEMIGGKYWSSQSSANNPFDIDLTYALLITVEELLEMLGIVLFIYALSSYYLQHLGQKYIDIHLQLVPESSEQLEVNKVVAREKMIAYHTKGKVTAELAE